MERRRSAETAAEALCLTAKELKAQGLIDTIVDEPLEEHIATRTALLTLWAMRLKQPLKIWKPLTVLRFVPNEEQNMFGSRRGWNKYLP